MRRDFRDLAVWHKSLDLIDAVYLHTRKFPVDERYGLGIQLRRAAVSVAANIAEGNGRDSVPDYLRLLSIARGSAQEVTALLIIAQRLGYMKHEETALLHGLLEEVGRMLFGLIRSLRRTAQR